MRKLKAIDIAMIVLITLVLLFAVLAIYCQTDDLPRVKLNGYYF